MRYTPSFLLASASCVVLSMAACGGSDGGREFEDGADGGASSSSGGPPLVDDDGGPGLGNTKDSGQGFVGDPKTCEQAASAASYVGCDYWPTVTANIVDSSFDYAVVVSNVGEEVAHVTVSGPSSTDVSEDVQPGELKTIKLPWVDDLKGGANGLTTSILVKQGAYHLVSDRPVVVYQFSALQYQIDDALSYTNDASLLLPSTAMTGNYRLMGPYGLTASPRVFGEIAGDPEPIAGSYFVVTGTQDGTEVDVALGGKAKIIGGGDIASTDANGTLHFTLDAGDVAEVVTDKGKDFDASGSLLTANKPVQVITGGPCMYFPLDQLACDHVEETVFPAETLGQDYVVTRPKGPHTDSAAQFVRLYGNVDGTTLTYKPSKPSGCPDTLGAGEVVDCGDTVDEDFQVTGDHEFGVGMYNLGASVIDAQEDVEAQMGDPDQSFAVTIPQYRDRYVFLAPTDYQLNTVTIVAPSGTTITLDGDDKSDDLQALDGTDYFVARIELDNGGSGSHELVGSKPIGVQVTGYGRQTSYQYPGGLNLGKIAPAPVH